MTQHRAGPSAEYGDHPASPLTLADMTDAVDALLNATQLSSCNPVLESPSAHPDGQELPPADNTVLSFRQIPNSTVQRTRTNFFHV